MYICHCKFTKCFVTEQQNAEYVPRYAQNMLSYANHMFKIRRKYADICKKYASICLKGAAMCSYMKTCAQNMPLH